MMRRYLLGSAAAALLIACGTASGDPSSSDSAATPNAPNAPSTSNAPNASGNTGAAQAAFPTCSDAQIVKIAKTLNRGEIEENRVAAKALAFNPDVQKLAQQIVDDHTKLEKSLETDVIKGQKLTPAKNGIAQYLALDTQEHLRHAQELLEGIQGQAQGGAAGAQGLNPGFGAGEGVGVGMGEGIGGEGVGVGIGVGQAGQGPVATEMAEGRNPNEPAIDQGPGANAPNAPNAPSNVPPQAKNKNKGQFERFTGPTIGSDARGHGMHAPGTPDELARFYVDHELIGHIKTLGILDSILIPSAKNAALKSALQQTEQVVRKHIAMLVQAQAALEGACGGTLEETPAPCDQGAAPAAGGEQTMGPTPNR